MLTLAAAMAAGPAEVCAESGTIPAAPPGVVETGAPLFLIFGAESLGLRTSPSDLHLLPDGRVLVVSEREIAIGDGVRWETYQQAEGQSQYIFSNVAVGDDGQIYAGLNDSIARIELGEDSRWRFVPVVAVPIADPYKQVYQFPDAWLWSSGSGAVVSWRPGQQVQTARQPSTVDHIFATGPGQFAASGPSGSIELLHFGGDATRISPSDTLATETVACSADFGGGETVVGTAGDGLLVFGGGASKPFACPHILGRGQRISDVCRIGSDLFAAAVDTAGIVFFERGGRIVQILSRTLDHRLSRVHRLVYSSNGVLWGLLDDAVVCVEFPSPISHFEPLLISASNDARPLRHQGKLWILDDGRLMRGVYAEDGYLDHLEADSPPGRFVWSVAEIDGRLFAADDAGVFVRDGNRWRQLAAGIVNARMGIGPIRPDGRHFFAARGEIGWIRESAGRTDVQRIPVKGLGEVYNAVDDAGGAVWLEVGTNRVGRMEFGGGEPSVRFFGAKDGLGDGWASIFVIDGVARFNTSSHLQRFDARTRRFVGDSELARRNPTLEFSTGRPARDASGRLWFGGQGTVHFVSDRQAAVKPVAESLPVGFEPEEFNMEPGGIIWMQGRGHLIRYDPSVPSLPAVPLRAQITSVQLPASNRSIFYPRAALPPLRYADNALVVRFAAAAKPFGPPVTFEVTIGGANDVWVSTGALGSASFNRLKEGNYVFRVRPMRDGAPGEEARLAFTVQPPWFRTELAWVIYIATAIGLVLSGAWLLSYLERREMFRLGRLVAERTSALAASEERFRRLNADLEARVSERTTELSRANADLKREISERQHAEKALRENEELFRSLFENNHTIMFVIDPETGAIVDANPAAAVYYGWPREELITKNIAAINTLPVEQVRSELQLARHSASASFHFKHRRADGSIHDVEAFSSPVSVAGRTLVYSLVFDITDRRRAEERIRHLNRTLAVLSDINQAIVRERELPVLYREACRIAVEKGGFRQAWIGLLDPGSMRVRPVANAGEPDDFVESLDINLADKELAAGPTGSAVKSGEHSICNDIEHDPRMKPWRETAMRMGYRSSGAFPLTVGGRTVGSISLYSGEPAFFDDEEITLLDELAMDLSFAIEHAEAEVGRRQAEERARHLAAFAELNPNPVLEFAADGLLTYANPAAQALVAAAGAADLSGLLPPNTRGIVADCLAQDRSRTGLETQYGPRTISWSFYPITSRKTVHCYAADITEHLLLQERYRQAQKMEAVGQLAGGIAHDFNNLLTVIQGNCSLLLAEADPSDKETMESAREIQAAAVRATNLTRQLLTFSRRQPMQLKLIELNEVVSSVSRMLQRMIGEDVVLHTSLLPGGAWVEGDSGMIEQVLFNLAVNARDAMPHGGDLWIGLEAVVLDEAAALRHPSGRPGSFVCLSMRDTGGGIADEHLAHIFEPFFTTKEVGKGTGLGLATVHGIVEQHRGWIEVESVPGQGTTFRVHLARLPAAGAPPDAPQDASRAPGGRESILIVEDEEAVRVLVAKVLGAEGYRVQAEPSGAAAMELLRRQGGGFDLLLTDLIMPGGVSGMQLAERFQAQLPALRVIYMSGYRGGTTGAGPNERFLQKPFLPSELTAAVRACLDAR
jgi:PAS domain S-box-containing protein